MKFPTTNLVVSLVFLKLLSQLYTNNIGSDCTGKHRPDGVIPCKREGAGDWSDIAGGRKDQHRSERKGPWPDEQKTHEMLIRCWIVVSSSDQGRLRQGTADCWTTTSPLSARAPCQERAYPDHSQNPVPTWLTHFEDYEGDSELVAGFCPPSTISSPQNSTNYDGTPLRSNVRFRTQLCF